MESHKWWARYDLSLNGISIYPLCCCGVRTFRWCQCQTERMMPPKGGFFQEARSAAECDWRSKVHTTFQVRSHFFWMIWTQGVTQGKKPKKLKTTELYYLLCWHFEQENGPEATQILSNISRNLTIFWRVRASGDWRNFVKLRHAACRSRDGVIESCWNSKPSTLSHAAISCPTGYLPKYALRTAERFWNPVFAQRARWCKQ